MRIEDHFRETLRRAVENEPPVIDAWDRFEQRARRGRSLRIALSLAGAIAVITAAAIVVPKLASRPIGLDNPPGAPDPYAGWQSFERTLDQYELKYPPGWIASSYEDTPEFLPSADTKKFPRTAAGLPTFAVTVVVAHEKNAPVLEITRPPGNEPIRSTRPDGRSYYQQAMVHEGIRQVQYVIDWSEKLCSTAVDVPCTDDERLVLIATIIAGDSPEYYGAYRELGEKLIASIAYLP